MLTAQIDTAAALLPSDFNGHPVYSPPEATQQQVGPQFAPLLHMTTVLVPHACTWHCAVRGLHLLREISEPELLNAVDSLAGPVTAELASVGLCSALQNTNTSESCRPYRNSQCSRW